MRPADFRRSPCARPAASALLAAALAACGGGGGGSGGSPTPAVLPTGLNLTVPAQAEVDAGVAFASSVAAAPGLRFSWQFGDGESSSEAQPQHRYARAGDFEVLLRISNDAGQSIEQKQRITVERTALLKDKDCTAGVGRGWCWLDGQAQLQAMQFIDAREGWVTADRGELWHTTDGGMSWTKQSTGINATLRGVLFASPQRGWLFSTNLELWATSDAGQTWQARGAMPRNEFGSVNPLEYLGGDTLLFREDFQIGHSIRGTVQLRSVDGGKTWADESGSDASKVMGRAGPQGTRWRTTGEWLGPDSRPRGSLQRSVDQGLTWQTVLDVPSDRFSNWQLAGESPVIWGQTWSEGPPWPTPPARRFHLSLDLGAHWTAFDAPPFAVDEPNLSIGGLSPDGVLWASTDTQTYRSSDFGRSWQPAPLPERPNGGVRVLPSRLELGGYWIRGLQGSFFSGDAGLTWSAVQPPVPGVTGFDVRQTGPRQLVAQVLRSSDGATQVWASQDAGQTWHAGIGPRTVADAVSSFVALSGTAWLKSNGQRVLRTADAGRTWQTVLQLDPSGDPRRTIDTLHFLDDNTGWAAGTETLYRTRDGGRTWQALGSEYGTDAIFFDSADHGIALLTWGLVEMQQGGERWTHPPTQLPSPPRPASYGPKPSRLAIVGDAWLAVTADGGVWRSANRGASWERSFERPNSVSGVDWLVKAGARQAWIGSYNRVWRTLDAGLTWQEVALPAPLRNWDSGNVLGAHFQSERQGWLMRATTVLATEDGGASWTALPVGSDVTLQGVTALDAKSVWLWGDRGVLATGTGGR